MIRFEAGANGYQENGEEDKYPHRQLPIMDEY